SSLFLYYSAVSRDLRSFPTRRSSDLRSRVDVLPDVLAPDHGDAQRFAIGGQLALVAGVEQPPAGHQVVAPGPRVGRVLDRGELRSEEHTSELQSRGHLVCRLLLEKKK